MYFTKLLAFIAFSSYISMFLIRFCWPADSSFIHSFLLFSFHHSTVSDSGIYGGGFMISSCILPVGGLPEDSPVFQYSGYQRVGLYISLPGVRKGYLCEYSLTNSSVSHLIAKFQLPWGGLYGDKFNTDVENFMIPASFLFRIDFSIE